MYDKVIGKVSQHQVRLLLFFHFSMNSLRSQINLDSKERTNNKRTYTVTAPVGVCCISLTNNIEKQWFRSTNLCQNRCGD